MRVGFRSTNGKGFILLSIVDEGHAKVNDTCVIGNTLGADIEHDVPWFNVPMNEPLTMDFREIREKISHNEGHGKQRYIVQNIRQIVSPNSTHCQDFFMLVEPTDLRYSLHPKLAQDTEFPLEDGLRAGSRSSMFLNVARIEQVHIAHGRTVKEAFCHDSMQTEPDFNVMNPEF